jgi:hypothetical protein
MLSNRAAKVLSMRRSVNAVLAQSFSSSSEKIQVDLGNAFTGHRKSHASTDVAHASLVCETPVTSTTTTKDELVGMLKMMYTMRRMEITNDTEYKVLLLHSLSDFD